MCRVSHAATTYTGRKRGNNTGSRGPFVPEIEPVLKIRDKRPPLFSTGFLQTGIKGPPRRLPGIAGLGTFGTGL
jgi:hypothetical protein